LRTANRISSVNELRWFLVVLVFSIPLAGQDRNPADYERYLIPVLTAAPLPGAYGAQWQTTLWLRNEGPATLDAFPLTPDCISSAFCFQQVRPYPAFQPQQTGWHTLPYVRPFGVGGGLGLSGIFLYVERAHAEQLSMRLGVGDVSRTPPGNTQIPIVPESAFFATTRSILGVPVLPTTRVALRIYTADPRPEARVTVRIHEMAPRLIQSAPYIDPPAVLAERTFTFAYDEAQDQCGRVGCDESLRYLPGIVQINNILDAFPELATAGEQPLGVRIEIEPATPDLRYWPLVTTTRDVDGFVSVFTVR
jgi:hypothetical protein